MKDLYGGKLVFERIVTVELGADHLLEIKDGRRAVLLLEASLKVIPELLRSWLQEVRDGGVRATLPTTLPVS